MEQALRDSCRSIRIGKILIQSDDETNQAKVFYAKLPKDISKRTVLLMYPILCKFGRLLVSKDVVLCIKSCTIQLENKIKKTKNLLYPIIGVMYEKERKAF